MSANEDTLRLVERGQQKLRDDIAESTRLIGEAQLRLDKSRQITSESPPAAPPEDLG